MSADGPARACQMPHQRVPHAPACTLSEAREMEALISVLVGVKPLMQLANLHARKSGSSHAWKHGGLGVTAAWVR